jgi:hypothetical protein
MNFTSNILLYYLLLLVYTYSACINAFAKSEDPNAPIQAEVS